MKFVLPADRPEKICYTTYQINYSDLDINKHANNSSYVKICYESVVKNVVNHAYQHISQENLDAGVKSFLASYENESGLYDELDILSWEDKNDKNVVFAHILKKDGKSCCQVKMEFYNNTYLSKI